MNPDPSANSSVEDKSNQKSIPQAATAMNTSFEHGIDFSISTDSVVVNRTNTRIAAYSLPTVNVPYGLVALWDVSTGEMLWHQIQKRANVQIKSPVLPSFSSDGRFLIIFDGSMGISVLDTLSERANQSVFRDLQGDYRFIKAISIHEPYLLAYASLGRRDTYQLLDRTERRRTIQHVSLPVNFGPACLVRLCYTVDGDRLFVVTMLSDRFEIVIFDTSSHERLAGLRVAGENFIACRLFGVLRVSGEDCIVARICSLPSRRLAGLIEDPVSKEKIVIVSSRGQDIFSLVNRHGLQSGAMTISGGKLLWCKAGIGGYGVYEWNPSRKEFFQRDGRATEIQKAVMDNSVVMALNEDRVTLITKDGKCLLSPILCPL